MILWRLLPTPRPLTQYEVWLTIRLKPNQARAWLGRVEELMVDKMGKAKRPQAGAKVGRWLVI